MGPRFVQIIVKHQTFQEVKTVKISYTDTAENRHVDKKPHGGLANYCTSVLAS